MENLFLNPGEKIKKAAKILFIAGLVFAGIMLLISLIAFSKYDSYGDDVEILGKHYYSTYMIALGFTYLVYSAIIALVSYISSLFIYGFGELVEGNNSKKDIPDSKDNKKENILQDLMSNGLITKEEYEKILSKQE